MPKPTGHPTDFESFLTWEALTDMLSYDPQTGEFRWVKSKRAGRVGRIAGYVDIRRGGYRSVRIAGRRYLTSRLACLHETKKWPTGFVDHVNGKRADDRWENLRDISPAENALNKALNRNNDTGVPGVHWDPERKRYIARLAIGGRREYLGSFETIKEASAAREAAEVDHYGEFRRGQTAPSERPTSRIRLPKLPALQGAPADVNSGLNHAMLIRALSYDPATGEFRWLETSNGETKIGPIAGKSLKKGYRVIGLGGRTFYAHRLAWLYVTGKWPAALIDHKDGNPANNSWGNLRQATRSQNNANRVANPGKSGVTGVTWHNPRGKWMAQASLNNMMIYLGLFDTVEEAAAARAAFDARERGGFRPRPGTSEDPAESGSEVFDNVEYLRNRR